MGGSESRNACDSVKRADSAVKDDKKHRCNARQIE